MQYFLLFDIYIDTRGKITLKVFLEFAYHARFVISSTTDPFTMSIIAFINTILICGINADIILQVFKDDRIFQYFFNMRSKIHWISFFSLYKFVSAFSKFYEDIHVSFHMANKYCQYHHILPENQYLGEALKMV
jgi:hypothetical protein